MGLDDFLPEAELTGGADQAALDEDLFDFPPVEAFAEADEEGEPADSSDDDAASREGADVDVAADVEAVSAAADDLLKDEELDALLSEGATDPLEGLDLELDLDLDLSLGDQLDAVPDEAPDELAGAPQRASRPAEQAPARAAAAPLASAELDPAASRRARKEVERPDYSHLAAAPPSRALWVLAGAVLVLNAGLLLFAWQAAGAFRATLADVRAGLAGSADRAPGQPARSAPPALAQGAAAERDLPLVEPLRPSTRPQPRPTLPQGPEALQQLELAREELEAGQPAAARRRAYRLLATLDAVDESVRRDVHERASFFVAATYHRQARAAASEDVEEAQR